MTADVANDLHYARGTWTLADLPNADRHPTMPKRFRDDAPRIRTRPVSHAPTYSARSK